MITDIERAQCADHGSAFSAFNVLTIVGLRNVEHRISFPEKLRRQTTYLVSQNTVDIYTLLTGLTATDVASRCKKKYFASYALSRNTRYRLFEYFKHYADVYRDVEAIG